MDLFRSEAQEHQQQRLLGEILLTRHLSMQILSWGAFVCALLIIAFVIWGDYTKKQHVVGMLMPDKGMIRIYPQQPGTVLELKVKEGERVEKGQILYLLTSERITANGQATQQALHDQLEAQRKSLQAEVDRQTILNQSANTMLIQQLKSLRQEMGSINQALSISGQQVRLSQANLQRYKELADQQFLSAAQLQVRQEEHLNQLLRRKDLEREKNRIQREVAMTQEELANIDLKGQNQTAALERRVADLAQTLLEVEAKREVQIIAPDQGIVSAILAKPGQTVGNAPLLTLLPTNSALEAELYVPSRAVGFIKPGKHVLLRYQAFPYEKFGQPEGIVTMVSRAPIPASELGYTLPALQATGNESYYRVHVRLPKQTIRAYNKEEPLQPGMALEANVLLDKRKLYEWLFEPLLSLTS